MELVFVTQPNPPIKDKIWQIEVNYDRLPEHIKQGDVILVDNGLIQLSVMHSRETNIRCRVEQDAVLKSRRHINLPGIDTGLPSLLKKIVEILLSALNANTIFLPSPLLGMQIL